MRNWKKKLEVQDCISQDSRTKLKHLKLAKECTFCNLFVWNSSPTSNPSGLNGCKGFSKGTLIVQR